MDAEAPEVSGISPKEGPETGGTLLTIRGQSLGVDASDIIDLTVAGVDCLGSLQWISSTKLQCSTQPGTSFGPVLVTTKSGGMGSSSVTFRYQMVVEEDDPEDGNVSIFEETKEWIDDVDAWISQREEIIEQGVITSDDTTELSASLLNINADTAAASANDTDPLDIHTRQNLRRQRKLVGPEVYRQLKEIFPGCNGSIQSKNFSPAWFLAVSHRDTTFEALHDGVKALRNFMNSQTDDLKLLLRNNFDRFVTCQDAIHYIHDQLKDKEREEKGGVTDLTERFIETADSHANDMFALTLERKRHADAIRNYLNVLNRFKFLFNLPLTLYRNIQQEEYDVAIHDYKKARSLFADSQHHVFQRVLQEVERLADDFRDRLVADLESPICALTRQRRAFTFLVELGIHDPAWICISSRSHWIFSILECAGNNAGISAVYQRVSDVSGGHVQHSNHRNISDFTNDTSIFPTVPSSTTNVLDRVKRNLQLVQLMSLILRQHIQPLCDLAEQYFDGRTPRSTVARVSAANQGEHAHTKTDFHAMLVDILDCFIAYIRSAYELNDENEIMLHVNNATSQALLTESVTEIMSLLRDILHFGVPKTVLCTFSDFVTRFRGICVTTVCRNAIADIELLSREEDWRVVKEHGGSRTALPHRARIIIGRALVQLSGVIGASQRADHQHQRYVSIDDAATAAAAIASLSISTSVTNSPSISNQLDMRKGSQEFQDVSLVDMMNAFFLEMLTTLGDVLSELAFPSNDNLPYLKLDNNAANGSKSPARSLFSFRYVRDVGNDGNLLVTSPVMPREQRIIIVLGNICYVRDKLVPCLMQRFRDLYKRETKRIALSIHHFLDNLDNKVFRSYVDSKVTGLRLLVEQGLDSRDWTDAGLAIGVLEPPGNYLKGIVCALALTHAEVSVVSKPLVQRVLTELVQNVSVSFLNYLSKIQRFGSRARTIVQAELEVIHTSLKRYISIDTEDTFKSIEDILSNGTSTINVDVYEELTEQLKKDLSFIVSCFK